MAHDDAMYKADGYVTAWFMRLLQGDEKTAITFIRKNPGLPENEFYQNQ